MSPMKLFALLVSMAVMASACSSSVEDGAEFPPTTPASEEAGVTAIPTTDAEAEPEQAPSTTNTSSATSTPTADVAGQVVYGPVSLEPDCSQVGRVGIGVQTGTIVSGGSEYTYQWTVPSSYVGDPLPVVLDFHGLNGNGAQQAAFSGWSNKAEREGFLSVQPTGLAFTDDATSWELPQFDSPLRDDVAMVVDLLAHVAANVCIDPARVYATGMANGGFFTAELVCDLSERIAAAVSVAGVTHHESCEPTRAVPYLAFHGVDDTIVPFAGGQSDLAVGTADSSDFFEQVMTDEFAEFAADFGCSEQADTAVTSEVTLTSWTGCVDAVELGFYTIAGAGHTWPGSETSLASPSLGITNTDIDATELSWTFFSRHSLLAEEQ